MNFYELLKNLRKIKGYTLKEVEKEVGISNAYFSQLENGKIKSPSAGFLYKLAKMYDVPYEVLMKAAGYIQTTEDVSNKLLGLAMAHTETLSSEESSKVAQFISFLRDARPSSREISPKRNIAASENIPLELKIYAERILEGAGVKNRIPVPENEILSYSQLIKEGSAELSDVSESIFKKTGIWVLNGIKKVLGILDYREKVIYVSPEIHAKKDKFVTFHEVAHHTIPWHQEIFYADDAYTLSFSTEKKIEAEANQLAAHLLFGVDRFTNDAADVNISIAAAKDLADRYAASYHAAFRRYVETHVQPCALLIFKISKDDTELILNLEPHLEYQYMIRSRPFLEQYELFAPIIVENVTNVISQHNANYLLNNTKTLEDITYVQSLNNFEEFTYETWGNFYNLFVLLHPNKNARLRKSVEFM